MQVAIEHLFTRMSGIATSMTLCQLEMRAFFGFDSYSNVLKSTVEIDPSRSPFMKERLEVLYEAIELGRSCPGS